MSDQDPDEQTVGPNRLTRRLALQTAAGVGIGSLTGLAGAGAATARSSDTSTTDAQQDATEITDWFDLDEVRNDLSGEYVLMADLDEDTAGYEEVVATPTADEFTEIRLDDFRQGDTVTLSRTPVETVSATEPDGTAIDVELIDGDAGTVEFQETLSGSLNAVIFEYTITADQFVGFNPIGGGFSASGDSNPRFTGTFDGQGNEIRGLTIDRTQFVGLFGDIGGEVTSVGVVDADIRGRNTVTGAVAGIVAGGSVEGEITESYATGTITGERSSVGGIAGSVGGTIVECYAAANIDGRVSGGLVGGIDEATITDSYTTGTVTGVSAGGIVGNQIDSIIANSYAAGNVSGRREGGLGGLLDRVGVAEDSVLRDSYWDTETTGQDGPFGEIRGGELQGDIMGLETVQMQGEAARDNMSVFDFEDTWRVVTAPASYPALDWQPGRESPPVIVGETPPQDPDGDGTYEDINGDGEVTIADVQVFFENRESAAVQNNAEFFNFSGNDSGEVTLADVQALYQQLVE